MKTKRKKRFKPKRAIKPTRLVFIEDIEDWIPDLSEDSALTLKVRSLKQKEFREKATQILHRYVSHSLYRSIDSALGLRTKFYLGELKSDILRIAACSSSSLQAKKIISIFESHSRSLEAAISTLWIDPNTSVPRSDSFRRAFDLISEFSDLNFLDSRNLREEITFEFYCGVDALKRFCQLRGRDEYEKFISSYLRTNRDVSNFLRGGKTSRYSMDIRIFEDTRYRFMKRYRKKHRQ